MEPSAAQQGVNKNRASKCQWQILPFTFRNWWDLGLQNWFGHVLIPTASDATFTILPASNLMSWADCVGEFLSCGIAYAGFSCKKELPFNIRSDVILWIHQWKKIGLRFLVTSWIPFCGHPGRHLGDNPKNQQTRYDVGLFTSHYQSNFGVWFWSTPNSTIQKTLPPSLWPASTWSVRSSTVPVRRPAGDPEVPLSRKILSVR